MTGAVTLMGIGSVIAKAADIAGPVLALHRVWIAAVIYVGAFLVFGGHITREALRAAAPGGVFFGLEVAFFFSSIQLTTVGLQIGLAALDTDLLGRVVDNPDCTAGPEVLLQELPGRR